MLTKGQSEFVTSYMGPWWAGGWRGLGEALHNFPKFQHCSPVQSLQLPSWLFMSMIFYTKTTLHTATTLSPVTIICFWNLKSDNDGIRFPWWWITQASFVDTGNRFYSMLCDIINYNDVISATDSLEIVKNVRFTDVQIVENIVV